jgi:UDP-glucose 4-epimerase
MIEQILADLSYAKKLQYVALRYFNAAGADSQGKLCERHDPETHLIPLVLQVAAGKRKAITIYGQDYPTPDGTCVRDYIHVTDLCDAHLKAVELLQNGHTGSVYNLGTARGYSVKEVIEIAQEVTGVQIPVILGARRLGDPAFLVADSALAKKELNWTPHYSDLKTIIKHAWQSLQKG